MSYYQKVLQPEETVLYNRRIHWIVYVNSAFVSCFIVAFILVEFFGGHTRPFDFSFGFCLVLISVVPLGMAWIKRITTEIVVTNKRILFKRGIFFVQTMEMNMNKVETVDVNQSLLGRFFDYGTVLIRGSGSSYEPLENISHPLDLRNSIMVR